MKCAGQKLYGASYIDGWLNWLVVPRDEAFVEKYSAALADDVEEALRQASLFAKEYGFTEVYYNGPGQNFADFARVRIGKHRILITQRFGWDI